MTDRQSDNTRADGSRVKFMYFAPNDVLVPRVDRQCIMRFCDALVEQGADVELLTMNLQVEFDEPTVLGDLFEVYGVSHRFPVVTVPSRQRQSREPGPLFAAWRAVAYPLVAAWRLLATRSHSRSETVVLYCKNYLVALTLLPLRRALGSRARLVFEAHVPATRRPAQFLLRRMDAVLPISEFLARDLEAGVGLPRGRMLVAHQGADLQAIDARRLPKDEARSRLGLPQDRQLVVYTGKVNTRSREIDYLLEMSRQLPDNASVVIVGGRSDQVSLLRQRAESEGLKKASFIGFVAPADVYAYQAAADVLVTYYPSELSLNPYRSPGKIFEYMAAQRPIVTADYPSLHEVLSPSAAVFVQSDRPDQLAAAIIRVLNDRTHAEELARQALEDVRTFTWQARAERVLEFVRRLRSDAWVTERARD
jgi:glycosyltransferase involved in cell wall biosynthesis